MREYLHRVMHLRTIARVYNESGLVWSAYTQLNSLIACDNIEILLLWFALCAWSGLVWCATFCLSKSGLVWCAIVFK